MRARERVLDLCGGAGIGAVGFQDAFDVVEAVDTWRDAASSYERNHRGTRVRVMDALEYVAGKHDFDGIKLPYGVLMTPPCQAFSRRNTRRSGSDRRASLTGELAELVARVRPSFVVAENVDTISPVEVERVKLAFRRLNYKVASLKLDAQRYGAAQRRKRWVFIALKPGRGMREIRQRPSESVRRAFQRLPDSFEPRLKMGPELQARYQDVPPDGEWKSSYPDDPQGYQGVVRLAWDKPAPTVTNIAKTYYLHPSQNRRIDVQEALTLFGVSGGYELSGALASQCQQVANAVPAPLMRAIAGAIVLDQDQRVWTPSLNAYN